MLTFHRFIIGRRIFTRLSSTLTSTETFIFRESETSKTSNLEQESESSVDISFMRPPKRSGPSSGGRHESSSQTDIRSHFNRSDAGDQVPLSPKARPFTPRGRGRGRGRGGQTNRGRGGVHPFFAPLGAQPKASESSIVQHNNLSHPLAPELHTCLWWTYGKPSTTLAPEGDDGNVVRNSEEGMTIEGKVRIAAFDLDGTIIKTRSGGAFGVSHDDWQFWDEGSIVKDRIKELYTEGYNIVIITNQNLNVRNAVDWIPKMKTVMRCLDVPLHMLAAVGWDIFRKPCTGMWDVYLSEVLKVPPERVDVENSFYVGDAAGTIDPKDWTDTDRKWADNLGLKFYTPQEFFLALPKVPHELSGFNPHTYISGDPYTYTAPPKSPELVLFVGPPGCGKSTFYKKFFKDRGYIWINQDTLKTRKKCIDQARIALEEGKSVVVDNTNRNKETRSQYLPLPAAYKRILHFTVPLELARHNNIHRFIHEARPFVPEIAYSTWNRDYEAPEVEEGWDRIDEVGFVVDDSLNEGRWRRWAWIGKPR